MRPVVVMHEDYHDYFVLWTNGHSIAHTIFLITAVFIHDIMVFYQQFINKLAFLKRP